MSKKHASKYEATRFSPWCVFAVPSKGAPRLRGFRTRSESREYASQLRKLASHIVDDETRVFVMSGDDAMAVAEAVAQKEAELRAAQDKSRSAKVNATALAPDYIQVGYATDLGAEWQSANDAAEEVKKSQQEDQDKEIGFLEERPIMACDMRATAETAPVCKGVFHIARNGLVSWQFGEFPSEKCDASYLESFAQVTTAAVRNVNAGMKAVGLGGRTRRRGPSRVLNRVPLGLDEQDPGPLLAR